ncbi:MAG: TIGR00341 family protein [Bradyrhizobium sp.]
MSTRTSTPAPAPANARPSSFRSLTDIYQDLYENRQFNLNYFLMLVMACLIALLGLLENSPAVIIGGMLISPLMGPILSCGLALTSADWLLSKKALRNLGFSVLETIIIAALATWLMPLKAVTPEILARTNPNLMDLLIAIFSGFAGTLALCSRQGGLTIIPGVAIAVAVMPPLATVGYGISTHQWTFARGAFLLFVTNLMAIVISANIVFFFVGFRARQQPQGAGRHILFRYRVLLAWLILIVLSIPLMQTLVGAAKEVALRKDVASNLKEYLEHKGKAQLAGFDIQKNGEVLSVDATVRTAIFIKPEDVKQMGAALSLHLARTVELNLEQVQLAKNELQVQPHSLSGQDYLASGVVRPLAATQPKEAAGTILADLQRRIGQMLIPLLAPMKIDSPTVQSIERANDVITVQIAGSEPEPTDVAGWTVAAAALADRISSPVHITGKILIPDRSLSVRFRSHSERPLAPDIGRARELAKSWPSRSDVSLELTASVAADQAATRRRLKLLRYELGDKVSDVLPPDSNLEPDQIQLSIVQTIDVTGQGPGIKK